MITKEQILHLANLARLKLNDEEIEKLSQDLTKILNYVEKINELELKDIEPMTNIIENLEMRDDNIGGATFQTLAEDKDDARHNIIDQFPQKENNYLKVPKILEK